MEQKKECVDTRLRRIADALMLNGLFVSGSGLLDGKMGIAVFFYHLGRECRNELYTQYAEQLMDDITDTLHFDMPVDFGSGLMGIGWGIEYLVQHGFVEADTDEALEEFDEQIARSPVADGDQVQQLTCKILYYIERLSNRSEDASVEVEARLQQHTEAVLDELVIAMAEPSMVLEPSYLPVFRIEWAFPWLLYAISRLSELGIADKKVSDLKSLLGGCVPDLLRRQMHPVNRLFLHLSLSRAGFPAGEPPSDEQVCRSLVDPVVRDGKAGVVLLIRVFAPGDGRYAALTGRLIGEICDASDAVTPFAGYKLSTEDSKNGFGLMDGIAGIGMGVII